MRINLWFLMLSLVVPNAVQAQADTTSTMKFLVIYQPGSAWKAGTPAKDQPTPEHGRYLLQLYKQGYLLSAGPFGDDTGAALVLEAADQAQATKLIAADPAIVQSLFTYEIHPWTLVPWERYAQRPKPTKE
jgi:uncharacterized protein